MRDPRPPQHPQAHQARRARSALAVSVRCFTRMLAGVDLQPLVFQPASHDATRPRNTNASRRPSSVRSPVALLRAHISRRSRARPTVPVSDPSRSSARATPKSVSIARPVSPSSRCSRLDVAMDNTVRVRVASASARSRRMETCAINREPSLALDEFAQRLAAHEFHGEVQLPSA